MKLINNNNNNPNQGNFPKNQSNINSPSNPQSEPSGCFRRNATNDFKPTPVLSNQSSTSLNVMKGNGQGIELQKIPTVDLTSNVNSGNSAPSPLVDLHPPGFNLFLTSHEKHSQSAAAMLRKEKQEEQRKKLTVFERIKAFWYQADLTNDENDLEREVVTPQCLYWLAPEIIRHEPFGLAADVYSIACVMWEITTRQVPFREMEEIMEQEHRRETEERKAIARERKKQIDAGLTPTQPDPYANYLTSPEEQLAKMVGYHHFRPTIPAHTHPAFAHIIRRCWHHDPSMRPSLIQVALELRILYHHLGLARGEHDWYGIEQTMMEAEVQGINLEDLQLDIDNTGPQALFRYPANHPLHGSNNNNNDKNSNGNSSNNNNSNVLTLLSPGMQTPVASHFSFFSPHTPQTKDF